MQSLGELAGTHAAVRPGLTLDESALAQCAVDAARFYAGYGDIRSLSKANLDLQSAPGADEDLPPPPDTPPIVTDALPIRDSELIDPSTEVTTGEWAIIGPLFRLYVERENAMLLEATRGLGADPYGRSVSEVSAEITMMENEILPQKAFVHTAIEVI